MFFGGNQNKKSVNVQMQHFLIVDFLFMMIFGSAPEHEMIYNLIIILRFKNKI